MKTYYQAIQHCPICGGTDLQNFENRFLQCQKCGHKIFFNPKVAVGAIIETGNSDILMTVRNIEPQIGKMDLPGGFVDDNETAEQTLARELKEELDLTVSESKYLASFPNLYLYDNIYYPVLDLFFVVKVNDIHKVGLSEEIKEFLFVNLQRFNLGQMAFESHKKALNFYLKNI